jgi:hypothetical protein
MGGSLGTAVLGAVFANRIGVELAQQVPPEAAAQLGGGRIDPASLADLPAPVHEGYVAAFSNSLSTVFLIGCFVVLVAFVLTWLLEERPLRQTVETTDLADSFAAPRDSTTLWEITREITRCIGRERTTAFVQSVIDRAGAEVDPHEAWIVTRAQGNEVPVDAISAQDPRDRDRLDAALARLQRAGYLEICGAGVSRENPDEPLARLTPTGTALHDELATARFDRLQEIVADWEPESPALDAMIARLSRELGTREPAPA